MKIINVIADSLAIPRSKEGVPYEKTYPYLIQKSVMKNEIYVANNAKRAETTESAVDPFSSIHYIKSDYALIQIGIVDCTPRLFSKRQQFWVSIIRPRTLQQEIIKFFSKHRYFFTKHFPKNYVDIESFEKCYRKLIQHLIDNGTTRIGVVNICQTGDEGRSRYYNYESIIKEYNDVVQKLVDEFSQCFLIDIYSETIKDHETFMLKDGQHISAEGNEFIAGEFLKNIAELVALSSQRLSLVGDRT